MGRKSISQQSKASSAPVVSAKAPSMKFTEAAKLADKTSRTIAKLEQLVEVINSPAYTSGDPNRIVERYTDTLKRRINKRLTKLARWSDSSTEERQSEFRRFYPSSSYNAYRPNAASSVVTSAPAVQRMPQILPPSTMIAVPTVTATTVTAPKTSTAIAPEIITPKNIASIEAVEKVVLSMNDTTKQAVSQSEAESVSILPSDEIIQEKKEQVKGSESDMVAEKDQLEVNSEPAVNNDAEQENNNETSL